MPRAIHDWNSVQSYHDEGHGFVEYSRRFGFCHTAWIKAINRGALRVKPTKFADRRRRYDWAEVQLYYEVGHTYADCLTHFGFSRETWTAAIKRGELKARSRALSIEVMIEKNMGRRSIKRRLLELGALQAQCSRCGLTEWRGKPLTIHIDHINGVKDDWSHHNLRMLCPNCHSQTPTFSGRNSRRRTLPSTLNQTER